LKLKVTIDGKTYEVEVEASEAEQRRPGYIPPAAGAAPTRVPAPTAAQPAPPAGETVADESKVCRSPIAGIVVKVSAQVGQTIQANDVLIVLEAMKMETTITSPVAGTIAEVNATVGDPVQGGQILIEFE
jgi:methylmalonyl-CoA carboxyltransferase small subunit